MTAIDSKLVSALQCAKRGWHVFPLYSVSDGKCACGNPECGRNSGKHPLTDHGFKDATCNEDQIRSWWQEQPDANIGIRTGAVSRVSVIDIDPRHNGFESLREFEKQYGPMPPGPRVQTGSHGLHLYAQDPIGVRNRVGAFPGIDVRGEGGYVVGPGSTHLTGEKYQWVNGYGPDEVALPPFPEPLKIDRWPRRPMAASGLEENVIPEGQRNYTLARIAGGMRRLGADESSILAALSSENHLRCKPPLSIDEVERIATSISRYEPADIPSAPPKEEVRAERILRFQTAAELATATAEQVEWVVRPWIARGSITEIDAKVKLGKTTWITHLVRKSLDGLPFMGEPTQKTGVVYLTEQPAGSFRETLQRADLLSRSDLAILFWHETVPFDWAEIVRQAVAECKRRGASLLIIDTIPQFAKLRGDAENSSGAALAAMEPLQQATASGLSIVIIRHERKSGGDVGDSGRGSSAFAGAVDTILSIRRPGGNGRKTLRVINAISRYSEVPEELVIDLTPNGYVPLGSHEDVALAEAKAAILAEAPSEDKAKTYAALTKATKIKRTTIQRAVKALLEARELSRIGAGKKNDPQRFWASEKHSAQTSSLEGQNENALADAGDITNGEHTTDKMREASARLAARLRQTSGRAGAYGSVQ